jgi:hypothetical protein
MIRFFKTLQPATLGLIPFIILIFWIRPLLQNIPVTDAGSMPLGQAITVLLAAMPAWFRTVIWLTMVSAQAIYFNILLNKYEIHYKNTYLPALIYALLISSVPAMMQIHPIHVVNLLILFILEGVFKLYRNESPVSVLFDTGFLAGLGSIIYFPAILILPFLLVSLSIIRSFNLKEWLIVIIAFFLPLFFLLVYMFWIHQLPDVLRDYKLHFNNIDPVFQLEKSLPVTLFACLIGVLLLLSIVKMRANYRKNVIRTRSFQQIFLLLLVFSTSMIFISGEIKSVHFAFLLVSVSVPCSYYFISAKKRLKLIELGLWGLIGVIVWNHLT